MDVNAAARSTFVTVIAWIFISLSSLALLVLVLQNLLFTFVITPEQVEQIVSQQQTANLPAYMTFAQDNLRLILLVSLFITIILLGASIGVLLRKNRARKVFIACLFFMCIYMVASSVMQLFWVDELLRAQGFNPDAAKTSSFAELIQAMQYTVIFMQAGIGMAMGWLGWKMMQPNIKQEFISAAHTIEV